MTSPRHVIVCGAGVIGASVAYFLSRRGVDVIVVHSFSRFFRDAFGLEFYLRKLAKHGVRLVSITQELGDDPAQVMMRQVIALFDEYQSKENAKHVIRSMKENSRERQALPLRSPAWSIRREQCTESR